VSVHKWHRLFHFYHQKIFTGVSKFWPLSVFLFYSESAEADMCAVQTF